MKLVNRVISPFLTIYKPQYNSMMSIANRICFVLIYVIIIFIYILEDLETILLSFYWFYNLDCFIAKFDVLINQIFWTALIYHFGYVWRDLLRKYIDITKFLK